MKHECNVSPPSNKFVYFIQLFLHCVSGEQETAQWETKREGGHRWRSFQDTDLLGLGRRPALGLRLHRRRRDAPIGVRYEQRPPLPHWFFTLGHPEPARRQHKERWQTRHRKVSNVFTAFDPNEEFARGRVGSLKQTPALMLTRKTQSTNSTTKYSEWNLSKFLKRISVWIIFLRQIELSPLSYINKPHRSSL